MIENAFEDMRRIHEEMDRAFAHMAGSSSLVPYANKGVQKREGFRMPASDMKETESSVIATFEIPGASKEDIALNVSDDTIEVKAQQKTEKETKSKEQYAYESRTSSFYRTLSLPAHVKADEAVATYKDGVLKVVMPKLKKDEKKQKRIEIT